MNRSIFSLFLGLALFFVATPTYAYFTTNQEEFTVNGKTAIYTIDFAFGHGKYDIAIPVEAQRTSSPTLNALGYEVLDTEGTSGNGTTVGIVLSSAKIVDGMYIVPKGKKVSFTLLTLYTRTETEAGKFFKTQVTSLPFAFFGVQNLALNQSELKAYSTKFVPLITVSNIRIIPVQ